MVANNFNPEHPQWIDQVNAKFGRATSAKERRSLIENWDEWLVDTWKPMFEGAQGSGFAPGETFAGSKVGFTTWVSEGRYETLLLGFSLLVRDLVSFFPAVSVGQSYG